MNIFDFFKKDRTGTKANANIRFSSKEKRFSLVAGKRVTQSSDKIVTIPFPHMKREGTLA